MEDGSPSQTALMVAVLRAHHCHFAPEPKILKDTTALPLSGMADLDAVKDYKNGVIEFFSGLFQWEHTVVSYPSHKRLCIPHLSRHLTVEYYITLPDEYPYQETNRRWSCFLILQNCWYQTDSTPYESDRLIGV